MSKETLIADLLKYGKQKGKTWSDYAITHNISQGKSNVQRGKAANDIWRSHLKNTSEEDLLLHGITDTEEKNLSSTRNKEREAKAKIMFDSLNIESEEAKWRDNLYVSQKEEDIKNLPEFKLTSTNLDKSWHETKDSAKVEITSPNEVKNVEELIKICNINTNIWEADSFWQSCKSGKWNISASFRKKKLDENLELQKNIILDELKKYSPDASIIKKYKPLQHIINANVSSNIKKNNLLEISVFDLHIGKLSWDEETGENYDSYIACERYKAAVRDLVSRVYKGSISKILLPIGNDMINVDNKAHTTTAGTPQHCDSRFTKMIRTAKDLLIEVIDELSLIAPVDVLVVPGNHDNVTMFTLGEILDAFYSKNPLVSIINDPKQRKYYQFGVNGIMFTHGNEEKHNDLGLIFATEQPQLWADTKFREAHLGHFHKVKSTKYVNINEETGFKVRVLPSLSGTDAWHHSKGYISNKSAEAYLWNYDRGLEATFIHNSI